jgi:thiosulfate/3-mercaptopyruvate sulfurtransferase
MFKRYFVMILCLVALTWSSYANGEVKKMEYLCDVEFVASKVGDPNWVILDGRSGEEYEAGHIPGAVNYGKPVHHVLKHPVDGRRVSVEEAERLLGQIGLDNNKGLIIYGTKGDPHVAIELLPVYWGVKEFCILDGGYEAWVAAGKKIETGKVTPKPAVFKAVIKPDLYIDTEELKRIVNNRPPKVTIIDVRSPKEYNGEENTVLRGGRIPGAINIPVDKNIDKETGKFLPLDKLREVYKDIPKDHKIILYCHRGDRASFAFIALKNLGYKDVVIYEDGYIVWGARYDTPVENEAYINMRPIVKTIQSLQKRLDELEKELEKLGKKIK